MAMMAAVAIAALVAKGRVLAVGEEHHHELLAGRPGSSQPLQLQERLLEVCPPACLDAAHL
jgi:hypothetical protein